MSCGCEGEKCCLPTGDRRHGSQNGYVNYKCRCVLCRESNRIYYLTGKGSKGKWRYRERLVAEGKTTGDPQKQRLIPYYPRFERRGEQEKVMENIIEENDIESGDAGPVVEQFWVTRAWDGRKWYAVTAGGAAEYVDFTTAVEHVKLAARKFGEDLDKSALEDAVHDVRYS